MKQLQNSSMAADMLARSVMRYKLNEGHMSDNFIEVSS